MSTRTRNPSIRPLFGFIIVVALGYYDWDLYHKLLNLRLLETGDQTRQRFERQVAALNHQADLWEAKADALTKKPAKGAKAGTGERTGTVDGPLALASQVRSALIAAWIDRVYGPLFRKLALNPDDLARFKALITEKRQAILDAVDAARAQGVNDPAGLRIAILDAVEPANGKIQSLLGDDNYALFRDYQQSLPARSTVAELTPELPAGAALTAEQTDAVVKIIAQGQPPAARAASIVLNLITNVPATVNAKDLAAAAAVLTPVQISALQGLQNEQAIQRDLLRLLYP